MTHPMLEAVPPRVLAERGQVIEKKGKIDDFGQLAEIVEADLSRLEQDRKPAQWRQAPVDIKLRFGWTGERPGIPLLEGRLSATVAAVCQRCLEPFELQLDTDLRLLLAESGQSVEDAEGFEVWEIDGTDVRPADIVEEALIMAMPLSALHESSSDCGRHAESVRTADNESVKPFAGLRSMMADAERQD